MYFKKSAFTAHSLEKTLANRKGDKIMEAKFASIAFDNVYEAISIINERFILVDVNASFLRTYGFSRKEEVIGKTCHEVTHQSCKPHSSCPLVKALETNRRAEVEHIDGLMHCMEISAIPFSENTENYIIHIARDITKQRIADEAQKKLIADLQKALDEVKSLEGILPICAHCKMIREEDGEWTRIETYIRNRTKADFTHGICPECIKKFYPEFANE